MSFSRRGEILEYLEDSDDNCHDFGSFTYNGELDKNIMDVLESLDKETKWYEKIAEDLKLDKNYIEFILHYLSYLDFVDYGTSPRGAWISERGRKYLNKGRNK